MTFTQFLASHAAVTFVLLAEVAAALVLAGMTLRCAARSRRQRQELQDERLFYGLLGQDAPQALLVFRRSDQYLLYSVGSLTPLTGLTVDQLRQDVALFYRNIDPAQARGIRKAFQSWNGREMLRLCFACPETNIWLEMTAKNSADGQYLLLILRDATAEKAKMDELRAQLTEAENANEAKTAFLSRMSHEIRTPINGQQGMLALAKAHIDEPDVATGYLEKAEELSQHLLSIINDVLDMSRIEADKIELEDKPFDLYVLGEQLRSMFQKNIEAKGVRFALTFENFDRHCVSGDQLRLTQVLVNFLSNAQKFTSEGEITVLFRQMLCSERRLDFMVRVHDTGIGMEQDFLKRIFRPFEQASIDTSRRYGGSGLGMAITDQIVRLMGGEIFVESVPGRGSDFTVFLHLPVAESADEQAAAAVREAPDFSMQGMRVLMAEDNEINAEIAAGVLGEQYGVTVEVAENGQTAVEAFASHPANYYDCILMDIQMPVMDGRAATRAIRALDRPDARTILIFALSADAFVEDERLSVDAGMNGHFAKPIDFDLLRRRIGWFMQEKGTIR